MGDGGIRMKNDKKYPVSYEQFKDTLLRVFLERDWEYDRKFTKEEKQEFIDNNNFDFKESYEWECKNYDAGRLNAFDTPEDAHKYIMGLLLDCEMYFASKESSEKVTTAGGIDESKYPMTYNEFKNKIMELYVKAAKKRWNDSEEVARNDLKSYFKEYDTDELWSDYVNCCEWYDKSLKGLNDMPPENVFGDRHLDATYVAHIEQYVEFFG